MLPVSQLSLGFSDAENYKRRENKVMLTEIFVKNDSLEKLCEPSTSFLVGDKGTGKTAYAVYMTNTDYKNNSAATRYIRETEYQKFITLKKEKQLNLSDFASIWKVIIYILLAEQVYAKEGGQTIFAKFTKFQALISAINEYYLHAFSPEIIHALQFVRESKVAAELMSKYAKLSGEEKEKIEFSETRFQTNLLYIQKNFESALSSIKLKQSHIVFIDGIDIRPATVPYDDYIECIKGLANAVWEINNDFFPSIRDSKGRMRAVLLVRPDIFASLGLQNQNTKIRDNAVLLKWGTNYSDYRSSKIFEIADQLLSYQQPEHQVLALGQAWDHYFPWDAPTEKAVEGQKSSFISFLRFAFYRPRDIVTMLTMLQEGVTSANKASLASFSQADFDDTTFRRNYADYLLGEVKDQVAFYYSDQEYESFLKFFEYLSGRNRFTYKQYEAAFEAHTMYVATSGRPVPRFMSSKEQFLQFLYELNVICYFEQVVDRSDSYIHWCFRDRTYSNISPKIKTELEYEIFYGMAKALNVGTQFKRFNAKKGLG